MSEHQQNTRQRSGILPTPEHVTGTNASSAEWYEREKAAFIAWWEADGKKKFSENPTLAAGAGWFARAETASAQAELNAIHHALMNPMEVVYDPKEPWVVRTAKEFIIRAVHEREPRK